MKRLIAVVLAAAFAALSPVTGLRAQDPVAPVTQQELAVRKFSELTESMQRLHAYLAKVGDEDDIKVLRAGMTLTQEKRIQDGLDRVKALLETEKWDDALTLMHAVRKDLVLLLDVLQNRNTDLQKLLEQIARLEAFKSEVDRLAKEQAAEKEDSARAEALQQQLEAIAKAKAATEQLLAEQKLLREATNALGLQAMAEATKPLADKEGELKDRTEKLATDLEAVEKKAEQLAAEQKAREAKAAADAAKAAAKPNQPSDAKPSDSKPSDAKPSDAKPSDAKPTDPKSGKPGNCNCSGAAKGAAQSMQQAQQQLGEKKAESSLKDQDHAIEKLKSTLQELDALAEEARRELEKLPFEQQAKRQETTQHATDTLAQKMEKSEQDGDNGEGKPTPGRKSVQQAVPKQKAAAGSLKEYKPAKQKQQDAKEDLDKAREELEEAINQLRQQLVDEVLRALEERFTAMLAKQRELSAQTKTLEKTRAQIGAAELPAALVERIQNVAAGEQDLETEAADAGKLLEEDGTTTVFPSLVEELRDELHDVTRRCRGNETGKTVQEKQAEVEDTLTLLINALRRTIEQREGGQPGQCNGQPPLVPISAELKVLKFLQERVNKGTKDYEQGTPAELRETDEARELALRLSAKEARVRELTRKLANKLNQENQGEDGR